MRQILFETNKYLIDLVPSRQRVKIKWSAYLTLSCPDERSSWMGQHKVITIFPLEWKK
jgi:hypothetical protein